MANAEPWNATTEQLKQIVVVLWNVLLRCVWILVQVGACVLHKTLLCIQPMVNDVQEKVTAMQVQMLDAPAATDSSKISCSLPDSLVATGEDPKGFIDKDLAETHDSEVHEADSGPHAHLSSQRVPEKTPTQAMDDFLGGVDTKQWGEERCKRAARMCTSRAGYPGLDPVSKLTVQAEMEEDTVSLDNSIIHLTKRRPGVHREADTLTGNGLELTHRQHYFPMQRLEVALDEVRMQRNSTKVRVIGDPTGMPEIDVINREYLLP